MEQDQHLFHEESEPKRYDKSVTSQVLDYYQRYSQNRELSKYFCGTSAIKLEDWHQVAAESANRPIVVTVTTQSTDEAVHPMLEKEVPKIVIDNTCAASPSSSIASNRKLEWDNGADIGYSNLNLHKSISLPVLTDLEFEKLRSNVASNVDKDKVSKLSQTENAKVTADFSSTSESVKSSRTGYYTSTTSSPLSMHSDSESGKARRLKILKTKVGLPIAESTPLDNVEYCVTPRLTKRVECESSEHHNDGIDWKTVDKISRYKNMKMLNFSICKPVVVECAGATEPLRGKSKLIQTSPPQNVSVGIQTDFDFADCRLLKPNLKVAERQSVFYVCYSDSERDVSNTTAHCSTAHTQTNSVELSNCNSFEYIENDDVKTSIMQKFFESKGLSSSDLTSACASNAAPPHKSKKSSVEVESPLTLLQTQNRKGNIKELQRTIELVQKLMKSKKYDSATKKFYVKKIMQKIVESKSESSGSTQPQSEISEGVSKFSSNSSSSTKAKHIMSKLATQTFTNEMLPKSSDLTSSNIPVTTKRLQRSPLLTLTNPDVGTPTPSDLYDSVPVSKNNLSDNPVRDCGIILTSPSHIHTTSNSSAAPRIEPKTWRDDKTRSEKIFDLQSGDFENNKVNFAKKERDNQLYWINNEIQHLGKLKKLLESPKKRQTNAERTLYNLTREPHVEDMKGIKKKTTVYVLSTEKENLSDASESFKSSLGKAQQSDNKLCAGNCNCPQLMFQQSNLPVYTNQAFGNENLNLQQGHLVSSEEFTSKTDDAKCTTVIRRYTFEIPVESETKKDSDKATKRASASGGRSESFPRKYADTESSAPQIVQADKETIPSQFTGNAIATQSNANNLVSELVLKDEIRSCLCRPTLCQCCKKCKTADKYDTVLDKNKSSATVEITRNVIPTQSDRTNLVSELVLMDEIRSCLCSTTPCQCCKKCKSTNEHDIVDRSKSSGTVEITRDAKSTQSCPESSKPMDNLVGELVLMDEIPSCLCECCKESKSTDMVPRTLENSSQMTEAVTKDEKLLTGELVLTDEIVSSHNPQEDRRSRLEKLSNELVLSDGIPSAVTEKPPTSEESVQLCKCSAPTYGKENSIAATSISTSSENSTALCCCCKELPIARTTQTDTVCETEKYELCYPCYNYHHIACYGGVRPYLFAGYVCKCFQNVQSRSPINELKQTIQQLQNLESETKVCQCPCIETTSNSDVCVRCNRRIKPRFRRRKGGLAYAVTVESDENFYRNQNKKLMESLQEIKIKVPPAPRNKKKHTSTVSSADKAICKCCARRKRDTSAKQQTNGKGTSTVPTRKTDKSTTREQLKKSNGTSAESTKQEAQDSSTRKNKTEHSQCGCCCCNKRKKIGEKQSNSRSTETSDASSIELSCESACINKSRDDQHRSHRNHTRSQSDDEYLQEIKIKAPTRRETLNESEDESFTMYTHKPSKTKKNGPSTLQEYLCVNKPRFIVMAEQRRQCLLDLAATREDRCLKYKKILTSSDKISDSNDYQESKIQPPFSSKEMKQITAKRYKKCREVQQKLEDVRERELRRTNKLLYDVFNKEG